MKKGRRLKANINWEKNIGKYGNSNLGRRKGSADVKGAITEYDNYIKGSSQVGSGAAVGSVSKLNEVYKESESNN